MITNNNKIFYLGFNFNRKPTYRIGNVNENERLKFACIMYSMAEIKKDRSQLEQCNFDFPYVLKC